MSKFKCEQCGNCCRKAGKIVLAARRQDTFTTNSVIENYKRFPYNFDASGKCEMLENNKCKIYNKRPLVCNVKEMHTTFYKDMMTLKEFFKMNKQTCSKLKT